MLWVWTVFQARSGWLPGPAVSTSTSTSSGILRPQPPLTGHSASVLLEEPMHYSCTTSLQSFFLCVSVLPACLRACVCVCVCVCGASRNVSCVCVRLLFEL